jgi:hypothetical protein
MKYQFTFERCEAARRLEWLFLIASGIGAVSAVFILLQYGLWGSLSMLLLSAICFGLAHLFDFFAVTLSAVGRIEESMKISQETRAEKIT